MSYEADEARAIRWALGRGEDAVHLLRRLRGGMLERLALQVGTALEENARLTDADLAKELVGFKGYLEERGLWRLLVGEEGQTNATGEAAYDRAINANVASLKERVLKLELADIAKADAEGRLRPLEAWGKIEGLRSRIEMLTTGPDPKGLVQTTDVLAELEHLHHAPPGLRLGWNSLQDGDRDKSSPLIQLAPEELSVIGARTSHGKTSFMVGVFANLLRDHSSGDQPISGRPIFYSAEESVGAVCQRMVDIQSATSAADIAVISAVGAQRETERDAVARLVQEAGAAIVNADGWTIDEIASHAELASRERGVSVILVDYLQRIPAGREYERRDVAMGEMGRKLKKIAKDLQVPVVVGAQANRQAAEGEGKMRLHHLREGGIEQEADMVLGLYLDGVDVGDARASRAVEERSMEVAILKNRNRGGVGEARQLTMQGRVLRG